LTTVNYTLFNQKITFYSLKSHLWAAADILRGSLDPADYRQPIMTLLFIKRLNDIFEENAEKLIKEDGRSEKEAMRIKIGITFSVLKKQGGLSIPSNHIIYYKTLFGVFPKKKFNL
jgi:type I restriction-modification system DNA methylase subunit